MRKKIWRRGRGGKRRTKREKRMRRRKKEKRNKSRAAYYVQLNACESHIQPKHSCAMLYVHMLCYMLGTIYMSFHSRI